MRNRFVLSVVVWCGWGLASCSHQEPVAGSAGLRWEAEAANVDRFPVAEAFQPRTAGERAVLSGGGWLAYQGTEPAEAVLRAEVPQSGRNRFDLWVRDFGEGWEYRLDDGPWQPARGPGRNTLTVVRDAGRYLTATWRWLGKVEMTGGSHVLAIRRDPSSDQWRDFAIDCFELRPLGSPAPRGWWIGDQVPTDAVPEGWMAFAPAPLGPAPVQLGPKNVKPAGKQGRIVRDGDRLVFEGSREMVRLWGVTASERSLFALRDFEMRNLARLLAARGVNFVRIHGAPYDEVTPGPLTDGIQRFAAAMKAEGIYLGIDWICTATDRVRPEWGVPGFRGGEGIQSLAYFSEAYQKHLRALGRNLLLAPNPHTGIPLAQDPAVGFVMIIDEDSPFFWTFVPEKMPAELREDIERAFGAWAARKHGSIEEALTAWGRTDPQFIHGVDAPGEWRLALYPAARLGGAAWAVAQRNSSRAADQAAFMAEAAHQAYAGLVEWLRRDIGYAGLVLASNWKTVDERVLGGLESKLYTAADATARNTYFAPVHERTRHFPWGPGDGVVPRSHLLEPRDALATHPQLEDYPHLLTEGGYENPNRYRAEEPLFIAAYYCLQGVDAYLPFQLEADWNLETKKWPFLSPATFGQSPAAAFIYRHGYVREGEVVFRDATPLADLLALRGGRIDVAAGLDDSQAKNAAAGGAGVVSDGAERAFDPLTFYVGRVTRDLRAGAEPYQSPELARRIDAGARTVRSITEELALDWGRGLLTIDAERAQAAVGFFGVVETRDAVFTQTGPHGAMALVSMDGRPLAVSRAMLLQVMTEERQLGHVTVPGEVKAKGGTALLPGERIVANGRAPILVRCPEGTVRLKFADAVRLRVTALDGEGRMLERMTPSKDGTLVLRGDALYYRLQR